MKIGMTLPSMVPDLTRTDLLAWMRGIDEGPWSSLACGERLAFPNPEMMVSLAGAAAVTERVRIAFTVVVLPLHRTLLMAKQIATLDVLSGGRVSVAVGVGGREEDYKAAEAPFEKRMARMEKQVAQLRSAWAGEVVLEGVNPIGPKPVQPGGPEILAGSLMPKSIRRVSRWADGISGFSFAPDPNEIAAAFEVARAAWKENGRPAPRLVTSFWYALGPKGREQMDVYVKRYLNFFGPDAAVGVAAMCSAVTPDALRDVVRRIADLGTDELILVPTTADPDELKRTADALG